MFYSECLNKEKHPKRNLKRKHPKRAEKVNIQMKEFTDFPKKDEKDPTTVFTDIHFEKKSVAYEAYHLSHGLCL